MKQILSGIVLALCMIAFVGCGKEKPAPIEKKDVKTLEEKAGDMAKDALGKVPEDTKVPTTAATPATPATAVPAKPKDHPAH